MIKNSSKCNFEIEDVIEDEDVKLRFFLYSGKVSAQNKTIDTTIMIKEIIAITRA
jgi:hypothetical protein